MEGGLGEGEWEEQTGGEVLKREGIEGEGSQMGRGLEGEGVGKVRGWRESWLDGEDFRGGSVRGWRTEGAG